MGISLLSTLHRSLITLSALQLGHGPRAAILANNVVTEADLRCYYAQWQRLQVVHYAQQARYQDFMPASLLADESNSALTGS